MCDLLVAMFDVFGKNIYQHAVVELEFYYVVKTYFFGNNYRSSRPEVFCKNGVLRNFAKLAGKRLSQSLFLNKVQASGLQLYQKRESGTGVFL